MNWKKAITILTLTACITGCKNDIDTFKDNYSIEIPNSKKTYNDSDSVILNLIDQAQIGVDSVLWTVNAGKIEGENGITLSRKLKNYPLGKLTFEAHIFKDGKMTTTSQHITKYAKVNPKNLNYEEVASYPHKTESYTQGLEFYGDSLYESTGQYKESDLRITDATTGETLKKITLPNHIFAEGMTIMNDKIYQLSWKAGYGFVYDMALNRIDDFRYGKSKQGWGLCNDGEYLYKSDGTDKIWKIDPNTLEELSYITVTSSKGSVININELEWINGMIYANVYLNNAILVINPTSGAVESFIDLSSLPARITTANKNDNVLNGIAYNKKTGTIFITGKRWDKMFEIKIKE